MNLNQNAEIFSPDGAPDAAALERTTHLGVGAHQDDLEILALHGIVKGLESDDFFFSGITCTDGAGSPRTGRFADITDEQMREIRWEEQRQAAIQGKYSTIVQLKHPSATVKDPSDDTLTDELEALLEAASPQVVYTHNLADKHDTHIAVAAALIKAIRRLPADKRPEKLYGVETWRGLDWLPDDRKVLLDISGHEDLALSMIGIFESQIAGGKRYDQATVGRWQANATYLASHGTDTATLVAYAMDLTPLVEDSALAPESIPLEAIDDFRTDVSMKLAKNFNKN